MATTLVVRPEASAFLTHHHGAHACDGKPDAHRGPNTSSLRRRPPTNSSGCNSNPGGALWTHYAPSSDRLEPLFRGDPVDSAGYAAAVEACDNHHAGRQLHAHALKNGYAGSPEFLQTKLVSMYGRLGCIETAVYLFEKMPTRNTYTWAGLLGMFLDRGYFRDVIFLFLRLLDEKIDLEFFVFPILLKACRGSNSLALGKQIHGFVFKGGFISSIYVGNALIDMYGKCQSLEDAELILKTMPEADCVSWNSLLTAHVANSKIFEALAILEYMILSGNPPPSLVSWTAVIGGFSQNGYDLEALDVLRQMRAAGFDPNAQTLATVLPACARLQSLSRGKEIHGYIMRYEFMTNSFVINALMDVYRRCGDMCSAWKIFSSFSARTSISVNTVMVGYCHKGEVESAKKLFDEMELYGVERDATSWNCMISGYVDNGLFIEALELFKYMQIEAGFSPDSFTLGSVINVCAKTAALSRGRELHALSIGLGLSSDAYVGGSLVEMYCKCRDLASAYKVFERSEKDMVKWNSLISGYARCNRMQELEMLLMMMMTDGYEANVHTWNGILAGYVDNEQYESALQLFVEMQTFNMKPDAYTLGILLSSCTRLANIERGKQLHAYLIRCGWDLDVHLGTTLLDMYAKCGDIRHAEQMFYKISWHNLVAYNTMLAGYATHGLGEKVISLFHQLSSAGIKPDAVTFLSVLSSCAHSGSVEQGFEYFNLMQTFDVKPEMKHYSCMVDLLSRAGFLSEAYRFILEMPMEPDALIWGSLLRGCVTYKNHQLGEIAGKMLVQVEGNAGNYIVLANLYASAKMQEDFARMVQITRDMKLQKISGCSWIDDGSQVHVFLAGDNSHRRTSEIYETLVTLNYHMKSK